MIISPYKDGFVDAPVYNILKEISIDIPIVFVTKFSDFVFNEKLYELDKWVLADFGEMGANDWDRKETLLWGKNSQNFKKAQTDEWRKFDEFVKNIPPICYLKREILKSDFKDNIYPIEFTCNYEVPEAETKKAFNERPISVFHYWGHSNEWRRAVHGLFFLNAINKGYGVVDNFYHFEKAIKEYKSVWSTIQVPHYARMPINDIYYINSQSKLSLSLWGAGIKCFRSTGESPFNSALVMLDDNLAWSYEWINNYNCFKIPVGETMDDIRGLTNQWTAIETIEAALENPNLYDVYCKSVENCRNYYLPNYVKNYLEPIIEKHL